MEHIIGIPLWLTIIIPISWLVHCDMVKSSVRVKRIKKSSFKELKLMMDITNWEYDPKYPSSLFGKKYYEAYFHASIIEFNGIGYILTPLGYLMSRLYQLRIRKQLPEYKAYLVQ